MLRVADGNPTLSSRSVTLTAEGVLCVMLEEREKTSPAGATGTERQLGRLSNV